MVVTTGFRHIAANLAQIAAEEKAMEFDVLKVQTEHMTVAEVAPEIHSLTVYDHEPFLVWFLSMVSAGALRDHLARHFGAELGRACEMSSTTELAVLEHTS